MITVFDVLYFIAHNRSNEEVIVLTSNNNVANELPPKPEERWCYIKELKNLHIKVQGTIAPTVERGVYLPVSLTNEQLVLLEQLQSDMRYDLTDFNKLPYNDQSKVIAQ
ncbi:hypothetical protein [Sodalis endosymbiont of Henestaris halophilus]|uniref:hypothetical protein n=1 Tax=Sodalis endosymbiont of Henestaris halophilus TaxID=1929246 RepID=UPI0012FE6B2D|nr:hypothetical protein [Sodalis endosymbiont of Henestaris halophilus]